MRWLSTTTGKTLKALSVQAESSLNVWQQKALSQFKMDGLTAEMLLTYNHFNEEKYKAMQKLITSDDLTPQNALLALGFINDFSILMIVHSTEKNPKTPINYCENEFIKLMLAEYPRANLEKILQDKRFSKEKFYVLSYLTRLENLSIDEAIKTLYKLNKYKVQAISASLNDSVEINSNDFVGADFFNSQLHLDCYLGRLKELKEKPLTILTILKRMDEASLKASVQLYGARPDQKSNEIEEKDLQMVSQFKVMM